MWRDPSHVKVKSSIQLPVDHGADGERPVLALDHADGALTAVLLQKRPAPNRTISSGSVVFASCHTNRDPDCGVRGS